ncbi:MAG: hypothetical protein ACYDCJ_01675 [Gammaproteobacteria bacterium]
MPSKSGSKVEWKIPKDAVLVENRDGWLIYHAPTEGRLYIYPGEYHAEPMPFTAADLGRWLAKLTETKPSAGGAQTSDGPDVPH